MKTQLTKPARSKARYTEEYKKEALELWRASGRSAAKVAAELGIRAPLLYRWAHLEREPNASKSDSKPGRSGYYDWIKLIKQRPSTSRINVGSAVRSLLQGAPTPEWHRKILCCALDIHFSVCRRF